MLYCVRSLSVGDSFVFRRMDYQRRQSSCLRVTLVIQTVDLTQLARAHVPIPGRNYSKLITDIFTLNGFFLGINFDFILKFDEHVTYVCKKPPTINCLKKTRQMFN